MGKEAKDEGTKQATQGREEDTETQLLVRYNLISKVVLKKKKK